MSGKFEKKNAGKKSLALMLALVMLVGCVVGGTVAWLMTETDPVTNTFVAGNIGSLTLTENGGTDSDGMEYMIIPGEDITKDPMVDFSGNNVDAYVFVKIENSKTAAWVYNETAGQYEVKHNGTVVLNFKIADGWAYLGDGVWYREVGTAGLNDAKIIAADTIYVEDTEITKDNIAEITANATDLKITAYAIQKAGSDDATAAWAKVSNP